MQSRLKPSKKAGKRELNWNLEKIKNKENDVKEGTVPKFNQVDEFEGGVEDSRGKVKETLLDILNNGISNMKIALANQAMINKMEERRKVKTTDSKNTENSIIN